LLKAPVETQVVVLASTIFAIRFSMPVEVKRK